MRDLPMSRLPAHSSSAERIAAGVGLAAWLARVSRRQLVRPVADHPGVVVEGRAGEGGPEPLRADPVRGLADGRGPAP